MKKTLFTAIFLILFVSPSVTLGASLLPLTPPQGGTGIGSATAGNIGSCLGVSNNSPFTYAFTSCGGGGGSSFSTSSVDYYMSLFRDFSIQGNGYLAPTTTRGLILSASSTISALTVTNGTTTNATTTKIFSTTASSTNLFTSTASVATTSTNFALAVQGNELLSGDITLTNGTVSGNFLPSTQGSQTLGSSGTRWNTLYVQNVNASNQVIGQFFDAPSGSAITIRPNAGALTAITALIGGNVGISSTTPNWKLSVAGTTTASSFIATSTTEISNFQQFLATNATSTNSFSTTASSTNLFTSSALIATTSQSQSSLLSVAGNVFSSGTIYATNFFDTSVSGSTCIGETNGLLGTSNCVSSLASAGGTLTISSPTGAVDASLNLSHANTWAALQTFTSGILVNAASSTITNFVAVNATTTNATSTNMSISGSLTVPIATIPVLNILGQTAENSTAASTSLRFYDGTASRALYVVRSHTIPFASSTLAYIGAYGASGTTTVIISNNIRPTTLVSFFCKTDTGTAHLDFSTGSSHTIDVACTSSGASSGTLSSNNTFTMRQDLKVNIGTISSAPNIITITGDVREDAD